MKRRFLVLLLLLSMLLTTMAPGTVLASVSKDGTTYTVEKGDNLTLIGKKLGMDWKEIAAMNDLKAPYILDIGQVLIIKVQSKDKKEPTKTPTPTPTKTPDSDKKMEHGTTHFDDITYTRPDFSSMEKNLNSIKSLMNKDKQYNKIVNLLDKLDEQLLNATTMGNYLNIMYSKDVTNLELFEEYSSLSVQLSNIQKLYCDVCIELFDSKYGEKIKKQMTKEVIETIYETHNTLSDEYIKLQTQIGQLCSDYLIKVNTTTIDVNGTPMTLNDLMSNSSLTYEEFLSYYQEIISLINNDAGEIYLQLVEAYKKQAKLAGFDNVANYMYDAYNRDYTKEDTRRFGQYVKEQIVPLYYSLYASMTQEDYNKLNSISGSLPQFESSFNEYFASISNEMLDAYDYMKKYGLHDFKASPVKQQLNYTTFLYSFNEPYISLYPTGAYTDISTFIHEFGHFYGFYTRGIDLDTNLDIFEIHSEANELLFMPYYSAYGDAYEPIVKNQILTLLSIIIQGSLYDEFQQQVFEKDLTSVKELNELFFKLECEYGLVDPASGYTQDLSWVFVSHTFQSPFYYISYAISGIPSLEIYTKSLTNRDAAIATYNKIIKYGTDYEFIDLLIKTNLRSPFSDYTLDKITDTLYDTFELQNPDNVSSPAA